jgi:hypothetical protein
MPTHKLWNMLWGPNPAPSNLTDLEGVSETDDPLLNLVAENSISIDIDEDTFIASNRDHMQSILEITTLPLSKGQFDAALMIFFKPLKSQTEERERCGTAPRPNVCVDNFDLLRLLSKNLAESLTR